MGNKLSLEEQQLREKGHTCIADSSKYSSKGEWRKITRRGCCFTKSEPLSVWCGQEPCQGYLGGTCKIIGGDA